ncbi:54S ribosomal protein L27, mitochondrial [Cytospora mali]|uniref:Large ribosomal subunit protein bL27m n=1 Tax=Cytospora mali TaxID=578113 RepID=A0A194V8H3_CYTMA|nr:54S ribosomal protein L27, mitochondrial [Valsa mali var. pyri (nom. inval.)]
MRLVQLQRPLQAAAIARSCRPILSTFTLPVRPSIPAPPQTPAAGNAAVEGRRFASVKSQGAYKIPNKKTLPKKLGAKKSGDQYVIPGNIIFKQRGTMWHPGENALKGRDHTIHAAVAGYVKYYRDPQLHPNRQYIGVAFNREDTLPYPRDEPRRRKLGMVAVTRKVHDKKDNITASGIPRRVVRKGGLYDVESLEQNLWSRDKARELAEARQVRPGSDVGAPVEMAAAESAAAAGEVEMTPIAGAESGEANPGKGRKKRSRAEQREFVHPLAFIQKRWLERRRTRTLHLNPRNYSYAESNAAIGRLASRTMYTAPWKLGGRKARLRSRRKRTEESFKQIAANRELVRQERERERIAEEAKRARMLAKQRAKGQGRAEGKKGEGKEVKGEEKEGEKPAAGEEEKKVDA